MINKQAIEFALSPDPDGTLLKHLGQALDAARPLVTPRWQPGQPLRLLLSGYFGAGNVGSDMRSGEILRQLRHLLGEEVQFSALAVSPELAEGMYEGVTCLPTDVYTADFLIDSVNHHHGVIACEGSMFKSTFSDVLSAIMAGTLGLASAHGKLAVGYGAEVGSMNPRLRTFVQSHTGEALILCRNGASLRAAQALSLRCRAGADTAWTFRAAPPERAGALLRARGWNGSDPVLAVCPVNPFWWPVRASPRMVLEMQKTGAHRELSYRSPFFHADSPEIRSAYAHYLDQLALTVSALARERNAFPVIVGMERVDERACADLASRLGLSRAPMLGYQHLVPDVIAVLRASSLLISSRFHALVGAMPAGVPSIGISMDERIDNLFGDAGQDWRVVRADVPDLAARVMAAAKRLEPDAVASSARVTVALALQGIGQMGMDFCAELERCLPDYPLAPRAAHWEAHLPPLPSEIHELLAR